MQSVFNQASSVLTTALIRPVATPLDWTNAFVCPDGAPGPPYDIILLTDCIFSIALIPHLISTLLSLSGPKTDIFCCYEIRDQHINDAFLRDLCHNFTWKKIPHSKLHPEFRNDMVEAIMCRLIKKRSSEVL